MGDAGECAEHCSTPQRLREGGEPAECEDTPESDEDRLCRIIVQCGGTPCPGPGDDTPRQAHNMLFGLHPTALLAAIEELTAPSFGADLAYG